MKIATTQGNIYRYSRNSNEIVCTNDYLDEQPWEFKPLEEIDRLFNVDTYIISITEQCNLRCTYCCYSGEYKENRKHSTFSMSYTDIDEVFAFIGNISKGKALKLAFYGGEPFLNYKTLCYAIEKAYTLFGRRTEISVSTNATLIDAKQIDWLVKSGVRLDISIDGGKATHDKNRIDILGNGSYNRVKDTIRYIKENYADYFKKRVLLLMTLSSIESIETAAREWYDDNILKDVEPTKISNIAPNFKKGVKGNHYESLEKKYLKLLDLYEQHKNWTVLKVFFEQCIAYWKNRPIFIVDEPVPMSTCLPINNKLYIDTKKRLFVCEKFCDKYPIGTIKDGFNWVAMNNMVSSYYNLRVQRCKTCPAIRMCNMCLTAVEYCIDEWNILCNNERTNTKICFRVFCEMAERGLIQ